MNALSIAVIGAEGNPDFYMLIGLFVLTAITIVGFMLAANHFAGKALTRFPPAEQTEDDIDLIGDEWKTA